MNGYELMAASYRKLLEKESFPEESRKKLAREIELYDFLAKCSKEDIYTLFDSGAFNEICAGYAEKAEAVKDPGQSITRALQGCFDMMSAKQAEDYYKNRSV